MRPPFTYYGGKIGMAGKIVALMPEHRVYIEPFFGSGAVFFAKQRARHEIVNDVDGAVVNFFRVLRSDRERLTEACALTPYARDEWSAADLDEAGLDDLERARRFFVRINQSFAQTAGPTTGWKVTTARTQAMPDTVRGKIARFADVAERLLDATIESCDAADLVDRLATNDTLIYADPPYLASARRSGRGTRASDYRVDMADPESHVRLAEVLRSTAADVILSGYPSPLYDDLYDGWWHQDLEVTVHSSNGRTDSRAGRIERIWCNYTPITQVAPIPALRLFEHDPEMAP